MNIDWSIDQKWFCSVSGTGGLNKARITEGRLQPPAADYSIVERLLVAELPKLSEFAYVMKVAQFLPLMLTPKS